MALTRRERKAALVLKGVSLSDIARELGVSQQHVSMVVAGIRRSPRVEEAVAAAIGRPIRQVFAAEDASLQKAG